VRARPLVALLLACAAVLGLTATTASASVPRSVLYTSTAPGVGNIPSVGVEAYSFNQIGDEVLLRRVAKLKSVWVQLSDWACQSGSWDQGNCATTPGATFTTPITLNIYRASTTDSNGVTTPGPLLATVTKTFTIPYRPSASPHCTGTQAGEWFKNGQGCFNGLAHTIGFTLTGLKTKLPKDVVWGVSYNSDNSGPEPLGGSGAPEDSLNVGLAPKVRAGHQRFPDAIFWDTRFAGFTCAAAPPDGNNGPFVTGEFNLDGPCDGANNSWAGFVPAAQFNAVS
jgi:hypothetical protein